MKSAWGFSATLLAVAWACLAQVPLAMAAAAQPDDKGCDDPTIWATTDQAGDNRVFRETFQIRHIKSNAGWATNCPVALTMEQPDIQSTCRKERMVAGSRLRIVDQGGKLQVSIASPNGKSVVSGEAVKKNAKGGAAEDKDGADWLEMSVTDNEKEDHFYVMMLDYKATPPIPRLERIPKLYMVEAFSKEALSNADCAREIPSEDTVRPPGALVKHAAGKYEKTRAKSAALPKKILFRETDAGIGPEPGKTKG